MRELTQKSGSFKEFPLFIHLLKSALDGGDEGSHFEIFTAFELDILRSKKEAESGTGVEPHRSRKDTRDKRYVILTYMTKLDKVHFPLALPMEEEANVPALRRTIKKLRDKIAAKEASEPVFTTEVERDLRQSVAHFRQENQELRHRLRQSESRNNKAVNQSLNISSGNASIITNNDLVSVNAKLMKKLEVTKTELVNLSTEHEKLKQKYAVDVTKLKQKIGMTGLSGMSKNEATATQNELMHVIKQLRTRLMQTERELRTLKLSQGQPVARYRSELTKGYASSTQADPRRSRSLSAGNNRFASPGSWNNTSNLNSTRLTPSTNKYNARNVPMSADKYARESAAEMAYRRQTTPPPVHSSSRHTSPHLVRHTPPSGSSRPGVTATPPRGRFTSPSSSSLGGRFDPTAYLQDKSMKERETSSHKAWGAGPSVTGSGGRNRYERSQSPPHRESGYASASSRGSAYNSDSSASQRSRGSNASDKGKKRVNKKKKTTPSTAAKTTTTAASTEKKAAKQYYIVGGGADSEDEEVLRKVKRQLAAKKAVTSHKQR